MKKESISIVIKPNSKAGPGSPDEYRLDIQLKDPTVADEALRILKGILRLPFDDLNVKCPKGNSIEIHGTEVKPYKPEELDEIFDAIKSNMKILGLSK